jgi:dipeptidyl aminopeptidase/acylaminoacyl peptidase
VVRESFTGPADLHLLTPDAGIEPVLGPGPLPSGIPSDAGASAERLTFFGEAVSTAARDPGEEFWFAGADGDPVHGFLLRPPGFSASRRYPLVLLIHGGPQGAFLDEFHYRWNPQVFAAAGAVVALLNPRGSSGYGQRFLEQISGDWGGRCYEDILRGVDFVVRTFPFVDPERMGAAGASFGGFMVNWIGGHANPFKALVSHDGVFFAETMAYTTDELWFDEHEHGGMPHVDREPYERFSPHRLAGELRTPTLVVHGGKDFRCPVSEGIGLFTALQVNGTPSRFLYFPDEGHWVLQPANAQVWYREVVGWLTEHLGGGVP